MTVSHDIENLTRSRNRYENALTYGAVASIGSCVLVAAQAFMSSNVVLDVAVALGFATIVDAQTDRIKMRKKIQQNETSFVSEHGNSYEKIWVEDLNAQEKTARKKNRVAFTVSLSSIVSAFIVTTAIVPHINSVMIPAFAVAGLLVHNKVTKKTSSMLSDIVSQRRTLVEQIHQRRTTEENSIPLPPSPTSNKT